MAMGRIFAKCLTHWNDEIILVSRANSEAEASRSLHQQYDIKAVLELGTREEICPRNVNLLNQFGMQLPKFV